MLRQMFEFVRLKPLLLISLLCWAPGAVASQHSNTPGLSQASEQDYLERAMEYRKAGDTRREQLELSKALHIWPDSLELRYNYALHLVRRKNYATALLHTSHSLTLNPNQPATANLHLQLLGKLNRPAEGAMWVRNLLLSSQAEPPLQLWSPQWLERWTPLLQVGRQHATIARDRRTLKLIEYALQEP